VKRPAANPESLGGAAEISGIGHFEKVRAAYGSKMAPASKWRSGAEIAFSNGAQKA